GPGSTVLWSSYHDADRMQQRQKQEAARAALGYVPTRLTHRSDMRIARVVIGTHAQLIAEFRDGVDNGIRQCSGKPRGIVFVDEHPELVDVSAIKPSAAQELHDLLVAVQPAHCWLPVLSRMVATMSAVMRSEGQTYQPVALLTPEEGNLFCTNTREHIRPLVDFDVSADDRRAQEVALLGIVDFIRAAAKGCAFYTRTEKTFVGYRLLFTNDYPGLVLLDATADLAGLVTLSQHVAEPKSLPVDYSPLELFSIYLPAEFRGMTQVMGSKDRAVQYGAWVKATVLANTEPGDDVLVIAHKDPVRLGFIPASEDAAIPSDWDGRRVNAETWGDGVGLNKWRDKTHVFTFGDHFLPRSKIIADVHALSGLPLTAEVTKNAEGVKVADGEYAPRGPYRKPFDGVRLRWLKQLSMRGKARHIDDDGRCLPMKLFTSATTGLLLNNLDRLFPGCRPPKRANAAEGVTLAPPKMGRRGSLINLLETTPEVLMGADMVERATGIPPNHLRREFDSATVQTFAKAYGWTLVPAREVRKPGRLLYLFRDPRFAENP
ncbi:MAG: hypothetical protein ABI782_07970, partial [Anaerolineaceae bacterium]